MRRTVFPVVLAILLGCPGDEAGTGGSPETPLPGASAGRPATARANARGCPVDPAVTQAVVQHLPEGAALVFASSAPETLGPAVEQLAARLRGGELAGGEPMVGEVAAETEAAPIRLVLTGTKEQVAKVREIAAAMQRALLQGRCPVGAPTPAEAPPAEAPPADGAAPGATP